MPTQPHTHTHTQSNQSHPHTHTHTHTRIHIHTVIPSHTHTHTHTHTFGISRLASRVNENVTGFESHKSARCGNELCSKCFRLLYASPSANTGTFVKERERERRSEKVKAWPFRHGIYTEDVRTEIKLSRPNQGEILRTLARLSW